MKLFLDANVLIDFMSERLPHYLEAATIFTLAVEHKCTIAVSSLSMVTSNYICCDRCNMPLSDWKKKVNIMKSFVEVCPVDSEDIFLSCDSDWSDYEDNVQYEVAKRYSCDVIVTRNPRDYIKSDIPVLTPDEVIEIIDKLPCKDYNS